MTRTTGTVLQNITWLTLGNVLVKPVWFVFIGYLCVRVLGDEGYGVLTATLFLNMIARTISDMGMTPYTTREVARVREEASVFITNFLIVRTALGVLALGGVMATGWVLDYGATPGKMTALLWAGVYTGMLGLMDYCRAYYQAFEEMRYEALSLIVEKVLVISAGVAMLYAYRTPEAVLGGLALGITLAVLWNMRFTFRHFAAFSWQTFDWGFLRRALPGALPLAIYSQFTVLYVRIDLVMVDVMIDEAAAGQYGVAYRLVEVLALATAMVTTAIFPRLSSLFAQRDAQAFTRVFRWSVFGVLGLGVSIALGLTVLGEWLVLTLYGAAFQPAIHALMVLGWTAPFMCMNYVFTTTSNAADDHNMLAVLVGLATLLNIILNVYMIPIYSFYGAAYATLSTEIILFLLVGYRHWRYTRARLQSSA